MQMKRPVVVITKMSAWASYFQVFILGFYQLQKEGKISLRFRCDPLYRLSAILPDNHTVQGIMRNVRIRVCDRSYNLEGYVLQPDGKKVTFAIDPADSPFLFDEEALRRVDVYFKMQCPAEISNKGFRLTDEVYIPYSNHAITPDGRTARSLINNIEAYADKIKPLAIGFRMLSQGNSFKALQRGYENYRKGARKDATKRCMSYFGNALGPTPKNVDADVDYNSESELMGVFGDKLSHPNLKRAEASRILNELGEGFDGRVISESVPGKGAVKHEELVVPIAEFCAHISDFQYNLNISGFRMSIPNRFMESFIVGTAIFTDKLAVKWYLPFDEEVVETVEMGYLPDSQVDWEQYKADLKALPAVDKARLNELYEKKWAPDRLAAYILQTCS